MELDAKEGYLMAREDIHRLVHATDGLRGMYRLVHAMDGLRGMHRLVHATDGLQDNFHRVIEGIVDRHAEAISQVDRTVGECGQADGTPGREQGGWSGSLRL
jgi:hypothetical protein